VKPLKVRPLIGDIAAQRLWGKAHYTLDALGLLAPRPPTQDEWDGLQSFMPALKAQGRRVASLRA